MALYKRWHTGLALMRSAKLKQTWKQRVRRLGRRKTEIILRLGQSPDDMVVVSDRLHDLDRVPSTSIPPPIRWWRGVSGARRIAPADNQAGRIQRLSFEINCTTETHFLFGATGQYIYFEQAYHGGGGWCTLESGSAKIVHNIWSVRTREEVYQRREIDLEYELPAKPPPEISYAEMLELDTSSFWDGWKRWFGEWVLSARVSIFGDR